MNEIETKILDDVMQPNAYTCQSAAICRVIGTYGVDSVRYELEQMGAPGSPYVMGEYMKSRVKEYIYNGNASLNDLIEGLMNGYEAIIHGWFTPSGHVIGVSKWFPDKKAFRSEDPWFEFTFPTWQYDYSRSGNNKPYSALGVYAACVASTNPDHAHDIYQRGKVDYDQKGMWLHLIKN